MRALKCKIDAHDGLRNVQQLFIKVFEYQKTYHMKTAESEIIKWLSNGIQPTQVKYTVLNALKVDGKKGRARRKRLTTFHRLLKKLATKFYEAKAMGLGLEGPKQPTNPKDSDKNQKSRKPPKPPKPTGDATAPPPAPKKLKCYHCGKEHKVSECPTCPAEKKAWKPSQWWAEQKAARKNRDDRAGSAKKTAHPGGEGGARKNLKADGGCGLGGAEQAKQSKEDFGGAHADGPATVAGVPGFWTADGGCNKATIGATYAKALAEAGTDIIKYEPWKLAKLADGTQNEASNFGVLHCRHCF